ncbi:MAG: hypothetical protein ACW98X_24680 [Promethearchaeota archaeon]|jgi:hypothetical protein
MEVIEIYWKNVIEYYNKSDLCNFKIESVNNGLNLVKECWHIKFKDIHNPVGFYEFLFNPIYKVFEVFINANLNDDIINIAIGAKVIEDGIIDEFEVQQPKQILKYLSTHSGAIK